MTVAAKDERLDLPPEAVEAIEKIERERDEFLSLVAHELKTPLTPLKTVAQLIRSRLRRVRESRSRETLPVTGDQEREPHRGSGSISLGSWPRDTVGRLELESEGDDRGTTVRLILPT